MTFNHSKYIDKQHKIIQFFNGASEHLAGFGSRTTPALLTWAQETGGTVCIEMLSGCLYINPLRVTSFIRAPERERD